MSGTTLCQGLLAWSRRAVARLGLAGHAAAGGTGAGLVLPTPAATAPWSWPWRLVAAGVVLAALGGFLARPVEDADLWWHLAYAQDMLARHTLIPDHALYSWTPADADHIYCAWLGELVLYGTYRLGGLPLLFALRYAVAGGIVWLIWHLARRVGVGSHPLLCPVLVAALLMCLPALMLKASLFSPLFLALTLYIWFRIRCDGASATRWCYALPPLFVVWVNTHGGWICGALLLILLAAGEALNAIFVPRLALPPRLYRHLGLALLLSALAVLATPYGVHYPVRLAYSLTNLSSEELRTVRDYDPVLVANLGSLPYVIAFGLAVLLVGGALLLTCRRRGWDWAVFLATLGFAWFYARMVRMTFALAPVFAMSSLYLLAWLPAGGAPRSGVWRRTITGLSLAVAVGLAGLYGALMVTRPPICSWLGFGVSYVNPLPEAEFIRTHLAGCRLGNDYNSGGYLIWSLHPETRVFIDPRYFPYHSWYRDYRHLESAEGIQGFVERHPCDAWCINIRLSRTVRWFTAAKDWKPICYGPSAVVFARRGTPYAAYRLTRCPEIAGIRNLPQAAAVANLALSLGDADGACMVADTVDLPFALPGQRALAAGLGATVHGLKAYRAQKYALAVHALTAAQQTSPGLGAARIALVDSLHRLTARDWQAGTADRALDWTLRGLPYAPRNPVFLYNAGVLGWLAAGRPAPPAAADPTTPLPAPGPGTSWDAHLRAYLKADRPAVLGRRTDPVAQQLLDGTWPADARPPVILPSPPRSPAP